MAAKDVKFSTEARVRMLRGVGERGLRGRASLVVERQKDIDNEGA